MIYIFFTWYQKKICLAVLCFCLVCFPFVGQLVLDILMRLITKLIFCHYCKSYETVKKIYCKICKTYNYVHQLQFIMQQCLTHRRQDKMVDILERIFLHVFPWIKISELPQNMSEVYSEGSNWQYANIGSDNVLSPTRQQTIIMRTNDGQTHWSIYASLSLSELRNTAYQHTSSSLWWH